jgi:hypothetical protein
MPKRTHNKSEFVRSLPAEMSAKDVVVKGREEGVVLTEAYVHTIRSAAKRKEGKVGKPGRAPRAAASAPEPRGGSSRANTGAEAQLMALVIEHGLPAVQDILKRIDTKLRTLV